MTPLPMTPFEILGQARRVRVSDGEQWPILSGGGLSGGGASRTLVLLLPHFGDFDSLEYAWWLKREGLLRHPRPAPYPDLALRAVGIGDRPAGQRFCDYTGFDPAQLYVDSRAELHQQLGLYPGLGWRLPGGSPGTQGWLNLLLMCAGIGSPGTLGEVLRGYVGDRSAPQLIGDGEEIKAPPLPAIKGERFAWAGGKGFQRPFELATLRLRNMAESLGHWQIYDPGGAYLTQRGGTFLFDAAGELLYEHRDRGILGFAENMAQPLAFLQ